MTLSGVGVGGLSTGAPITHRIFGLSMARRFHERVVDVHCNNQYGIVMSWGWEFFFLH